MGRTYNPDARWQRTVGKEAFGKPGSNKDIDQGFYESDIYKNFSFTGMTGVRRHHGISESKYGFGGGSGTFANKLTRAKDNAYEQYLASLEKSKKIDSININRENTTKRRGKKLMIASPTQGLGISGGLL